MERNGGSRSALRDSREDYEHLCSVIKCWNERRVELFKITMPTEKLEFEGVMKFYFQYESRDGQKVATKCIRVQNSATVDDVIEVLVQKFRPDLRMLPNLASYVLYEVHNEKGQEEERKMKGTEKPLLEQLKWVLENKDGRFLLRNESMPLQFQSTKLTKAQRKALFDNTRKEKEKKRSPRESVGREKFDVDSAKTRGAIARSLYQIYPPSRFTRSITNPDIVRSKWRQGDKSLKEGIQPNMADSDTSDCEALQVYADALFTDTPCKSILVTKGMTAAQIVQVAVDKFNLGDDPGGYCLVEVTGPSMLGSTPHVGVEDVQERILNDEDVPLQVHCMRELVRGSRQYARSIQLQLRRKSSFRSRSLRSLPVNTPTSSALQSPVLLDLNHTPTSSPAHKQQLLPITSSSTEIGSHISKLQDPHSGLCLTSPGICPRHCVIMGSVTNGYSIAPLDKSAVVVVDNCQILEPVPLPNKSVIQLGQSEVFQFLFPESQNHPVSSSDSFRHTHNIPHKAHSTNDLSPPRKMSEDLASKTVSGHGIADEQAALRSGEDAGGKVDQNREFRGDSIAATHSPSSLHSPSVKLQDQPHLPSSSPSSSPRSTRHRHNSASFITDQELVAKPASTEHAVLPASLIVHPGREGLLLQALTLEVNGYCLQFKLAPAYSLYMVARYNLSASYNRAVERHQSLVQLLRSTCSLIKKAVKDSRNIPGALAFWLANSSEFLHFLRRDYRLCVLAQEYEGPLISITRNSLRHFTECMVRELGLFLPAFWSKAPDPEGDDHLSLQEPNSQEPDVVPTATRRTSITSLYWSVTSSKMGRHSQPNICDILTTLQATKSLLHTCRVNSTLQNAIFNFLFRYMSTRLFNKLVIDPKLCSLAVGTSMLRRLKRVREWADREGLKVPVDEHLNVIIQAAHLLSSSKHTIEDVQSTHAHCTQLNSRQVSTILHNYQLTEGEESISRTYLNELLRVVHTHVDQQLNPASIHLQEDPNHELPFLLPEHGYSCDTMRGVPVGLEEFLENVTNAGYCKLVVAKDSIGCWIPPRVTNQNSPFSTQASTQMSQTLPRNFGHASFESGHDLYARPQSAQPGTSPPPSEKRGGGGGGGGLHQPELRIACVTLGKGLENSLGINIKEIKINQYGSTGIFVISLSDEGPAHKDGSLQPGDQLLRINNISLEKYNREMVVNVLRSVSEQVTLTIAKEAAQFYGILLNQSPSNSRKQNSTETIQFGPPKEGTSHAKKAARREQRSRQQLHQPDYPEVQHHQNYVYEYPPTSENPVFPSPSHLPSGSSGNPQLARWIHEQQHLVQQKSLNYHKSGSHTPYTESTPSISSHIPEREIPSHHLHQTLQNQFSSRPYASYQPDTPPEQDNPSGRHKTPERGKLQAIESLSPKLDVTSTGLDETDLSKYFAASDQMTSDGSYQDASQLPYNNSLSAQPSGTQSTQSFGPSYHMDKLSMQVACHTQLTPGGEIPVVSVLEHLNGRKGKGEIGTLHPSELKQLDMDDIGLLKQRMQLLFYEQKKKKEECHMQEDGAEMSHVEVQGNRQGWKAGLGESSNDFPSKDNMDEAKKEDLSEDSSDLVDPDKLLQITKLRNDLDSLYKLISDQKRRCREIHFAREREEQSLRQAELKFRTQSSQQFMHFVRPEDETRWQRDQRRRLKEWERINLEKTRHLQQIDIDEHHARSKQKALEQHYSEIKRQLHTLEASVSPSCVRLQGEKVHATGLASKMHDYPERDWMGGRSSRVMSTDSINTSSSWMSADNHKALMDTYGSESNIASMSSVDSSSAAMLHSPVGLRSETSSPSVLGDSPSYWLPPRDQTGHPSPEYGRQESRLHALREEHQHHKMNSSGMSSRSSEEKNAHLFKLKMEVQRVREQAKLQYHSPVQLKPSPSPLLPPSNASYHSYRREPDTFLYPSTPESSRPSSTPDIIPGSFTGSLANKQSNQHPTHGLQKSLSSVIPSHAEQLELEHSRSSSNLHQQQAFGHAPNLYPTNHAAYNTRHPSHQVHMEPATPANPPLSLHTQQRSRDQLQSDSTSITKIKEVATEHPVSSKELLGYPNSSHSPRPTGQGMIESDKSPVLPHYRKPIKAIGSSGPQRYSRGRPEPQNSEDKSRFSSQTVSGGRQYRQQTEL